MTSKKCFPSILITILSFTITGLLFGCGENWTAGGPGSGGTGPIYIPISTLSDIDLIARSNTQDFPDKPLPKPDIFYPNEDLSPSPNQKNENHYSQTTISKSPDLQQCGTFTRSINLVDVNNKPISTEFIEKDSNEAKKVIRLQLKVSNITNDKIFEIRNNCQSFEILDSKGKSIIHQQDSSCKTKKESLVYFANQTHTYKLNLSKVDELSSGTYRVNYLNKVEGSNQHNCNTFLEFNIQK